MKYDIRKLAGLIAQSVLLVIVVASMASNHPNAKYIAIVNLVILFISFFYRHPFVRLTRFIVLLQLVFLFNILILLLS